MCPFAFNQVRGWLVNSNKLAKQNAIANDREIVYPLLCYCKTVHFLVMSCSHAMAHVPSEKRIIECSSNALDRKIFSFSLTMQFIVLFTRSVRHLPVCL